jgi:oligopeptide/dipeptide ABC transporter, ATP-binding protein, C-terminal domain
MFITHDLSVVKHISDEIAVMYLGQCVERCAADELFRNPLHPYTKALLAAIPVPKLRDRRERVLIRGEVSDPIDPKPACRFHTRCDLCNERCTSGEVPLVERAPGHYVACTLFGEP